MLGPSRAKRIGIPIPRAAYVRSHTARNPNVRPEKFGLLYSIHDTRFMLKP
jgi:hypothetical protein